MKGSRLRLNTLERREGPAGEMKGGGTTIQRERKTQPLNDGGG